MVKQVANLYRRDREKIQLNWRIADGIVRWNVFTSVDNGLTFSLNSHAANRDDRFGFDPGRQTPWLGGTGVFHQMALESISGYVSGDLGETPVFIKLQSEDIAGNVDPVDLADVRALSTWPEREMNRHELEQQDTFSYREFRLDVPIGEVFADNIIDIVQELGRRARSVTIETDHRILIKFNSIFNDSIEIKDSEERTFSIDEIFPLEKVFIENDEAPEFPDDAAIRITIT